MRYFLSLVCLFYSFSSLAQLSKKDEKIIYEVISSLKQDRNLRILNKDTIFVSVKGIDRNICNYFFVEDKAILLNQKQFVVIIMKVIIA